MKLKNEKWPEKNIVFKIMKKGSFNTANMLIHIIFYNTVTFCETICLSFLKIVFFFCPPDISVYPLQCTSTTVSWLNYKIIGSIMWTFFAGWAKRALCRKQNGNCTITNVFSLSVLIQLLLLYYVFMLFPLQYQTHLFECKMRITSSLTVALCCSLTRLTQAGHPGSLLNLNTLN